MTVDFTAGALPARWINGGTPEPRMQVHAYDEHTFVLRQNMAVHWEAPFLYLLCGNDRALLLDTGADPDLFPVRETVDGLLERWLSDHPRTGYELVVAHTHGHGDHIAGDVQFAGRPHTTVVPVDVADVRSFFGFTDWPAQVVPFDLGGRVLEVTGIPGHHEASIAIHDPWTGFLLTGDTVIPGRLYVPDFPAFLDSLDRLVALTETRPVTHVMGCHIEMTRRPGRDYPIGAKHQPDEPPLQLTVTQLTTIRDAAHRVATQPGVHRLADAVIFHGRCEGARRWHRVRALWHNLRH